MIHKLQNILYKEATNNYLTCHNKIRHIIEDSVGTIESDLIDEIIFIIVEEYHD